MHRLQEKNSIYSPFQNSIPWALILITHELLMAQTVAARAISSGAAAQSQNQKADREFGENRRRRICTSTESAQTAAPQQGRKTESGGAGWCVLIVIIVITVGLAIVWLTGAVLGAATANHFLILIFLTGRASSRSTQTAAAAESWFRELGSAREWLQQHHRRLIIIKFRSFLWPYGNNQKPDGVTHAMHI